MIAPHPDPPKKWQLSQYQQKALEKQKLNLSRSTPPRTKTTASLKYSVNDCRSAIAQFKNSPLAFPPQRKDKLETRMLSNDYTDHTTPPVVRDNTMDVIKTYRTFGKNHKMVFKWSNKATAKALTPSKYVVYSWKGPSREKLFGML